MGVQGSKSSYSGTDVINRESVLSAGGTASVTTPDKLTIDGSTLSGNRVEVDAGALAVASRQDTSTFTSKDKSYGASVSYQIGGSVSAQGNMVKGSQQGDFASVKEQAGIVAGAGGFEIDVKGHTDLKGAVIASDADPSKNILTTGTLTVSDIENKESYKAKSTSLGIGLGDIGVDGKNRPTSDSSGTPIPGINTPLGNLTATPPIALSASGKQSGTTNSAIAPGTITITSGDAASQAAADTVSRDTASANAGALSQEFDEAKRAEIDQAFGAARLLAAETTTFFARRAAEEAEKRAEAKAKEAEAAEARKAGDTARADALEADANALKDQADKIGAAYGNGSAIRTIATALNGAAGGDVTGGLSGLVQSAAVNVLQSLAVNEVKQLVDGIKGDDATRESVRAALQAVVGCAGAAAGGSGDCGSAAMGAAASVVLMNLLVSKDPPKDSNYDGIVDSPTLEEQQAITNIVTTLITGIAEAAGLDAPSAALAARTEIENNSGCAGNANLGCDTSVAQIARGDGKTLKELLSATGKDGKPKSDEERIADLKRHQEYVDQFGSPERAEAFLVGRDEFTILADKMVNHRATPEEQARYFNLLKAAGGIIETAKNILGLTHYYSLPGNLVTLESNPNYDNASLGEQARFLAAFGKGTANGVVDDLKDAAQGIGDIISDPGKAWEDTKQAVEFIWNNPDKFIELLGDQGKQYVDDVKAASILYEAALISGDTATQSKAAEQLGNLVGAPIAGAVLTGGLGAGIKALKIGDKIIEILPNHNVSKLIANSRLSSSPLDNAQIISKDSANELNAAFSGGNSSYDPPWMPGSTVTTFVTTKATQLVRVSTGSTGGSWLVHADTIAGKTPEQIKELLALEEVPSYIQAVDVPAGTRMQEGLVGPQPKLGAPSNPGAIQFHLPAGSRIPNNSFGKLQPLKSGKPVG